MNEARGVTVEANAVHRYFGTKAVLRDLHFQAATGDFVAIVGRSGEGKSTLLRLFAGLDRPDRGSIVVDGKPLDGLYPAARILFQDGRLLPWLRVGENVGLGLPNPNIDLVNRMLRNVGLEDRVNDWPGILSGGQKQRVALARALAASPALLLLDEPLASVDALTRLEMQRLIESLCSECGATTILITHDVEEAVSLADRVYLLAGGRLDRKWEVDLPRPRDRSHPAFHPLVRSILVEVMGEAGSATIATSNAAP